MTRVLLTGGHGMLGTSIAAAWSRGRTDDVVIRPSRSDIDLRDAAAVRDLVDEVRPDLIVHLAAKVGGIGAKLANPTRYLLDNLRIDSAVFDASIEAGVGELLYVSSAAVYPEHADQPIPESALLTGELEDANEGYGLAKIAGLKLCEYVDREFGLAYRAILPSNLYGPHDDFSAGHGHLIAAAIGKVHAAKSAGESEVLVWGDGTARREFVFAPDLAEWIVGRAGRLGELPVRLNLGAGADHSITEYYEAVARALDFDGRLVYDTSKPAGAARRLLDSSAATAFGWSPATPLDLGIADVARRYLVSLEGTTR